MAKAYSLKYRPKTMGDYIGDRIKKAVAARFAEVDNYPTSILLYGPRGCGKTSAARLMSKEYHCENKVNGHACGECYMCKEIESYIETGEETPGVIELDIATDSGKAAIAEMIEEAKIPPMYPMKYKVVILDECQQASQAAQNQLLKVVEEPPKHLKFLFCTTNEEKLIEPLKSRCGLKLQVRMPDIKDMIAKLLYICESEGIKTSNEALRVIAQHERVPREAINMLESIAKENGMTVTLKETREFVGGVASEVYFKYFDVALSDAGVIENVMLFMKELKDNNIQSKEFMQGLIRFVLDCSYIRYGINLEMYPVEVVTQSKKVFSRLSTMQIDTVMQIVEHGVKLMGRGEAMDDLMVVNTALRINKSNIIAYNAIEEELRAARENRQSLIMYDEGIKEEAMAEITKKTIEISPDELADVMGGAVTRVESTINDIVISETRVTEQEDDDSGMLTDDELMNLFTSGV